MDQPLIERYPIIKDAFSLGVFILLAILGALVINTFVFKSFNVVGPSMENTLATNDRLIVNRVPVTWATIQNKEYIPERGEVIVFKNPRYTIGSPDEFIVKRVIAFAGERVTVNGGILTVYNEEFPNGFQPDQDFDGPKSPTTGSSDTVVSEGTIFVAGDNRIDNFSFDSRNGLGLVPLYDIVGPVSLRVFPVTKVRLF